MNNELMFAADTLARHAVRRIEGMPGRRVACLTGSLWITQDGDARDIVIGAGAAFSFDRTGQALIGALADSSFLLLGAVA